MAGRVPTIRQTLSGSTVRTTQPRGAPPAPVQQSADRQVNDLQRGLAQATQAARQHPHGNGLYVAKAVSFQNGITQTIPHGLGRAFQGYEVKNHDSFARFKKVSNPSSSLDARQIQIQSDADCTADVWVF